MLGKIVGGIAKKAVGQIAGKMGKAGKGGKSGGKSKMASKMKQSSGPGEIKNLMERLLKKLQEEGKLTPQLAQMIKGAGAAAAAQPGAGA